MHESSLWADIVKRWQRMLKMIKNYFASNLFVNKNELHRNVMRKHGALKELNL